MFNLMIDLESLALDNNAIIPQIGFLIFDEHYLPCGELCVNIDITSSLMDGFNVDPKTIKFWRDQDTAVVNSVLYSEPRLKPRLAAQLIDKWIKDTFKGEDFMIWANGILFDVPKIDNLMTRYGLSPLTSHTRYNNIHDFRTLRNTAKALYPAQYEHANSIIKNESTHNALADCYWQLETLGAIMQILSGDYHLVKQNESVPPTTDKEPKIQEWESNKEPEIKEWEEVENSGDFLEHVYGETEQQDEFEPIPVNSI